MDCCHRLTDAFNVKYVYTSPGTTLSSSLVPANPVKGQTENPSDPPLPSLNLLYDGPNKVYENQEALPRAWIVHQVMQAQTGDFQAIKRKLKDPDFDLKTRAVIEIDNPDKAVVRLAPNQDYDEEVRILRYLPERVEMTASLQKTGLLVLADSYYPGWKVYVDGQESQVIPTNLTMRGVILSQGQHSVEFVYQPDLLWIGLAIAGLTLIGVLAAALAKANSSVL